ncbi:MAG TPA: plastocyanin/azurin family copper-binding protein [Tepidisphaeraceae bacterium]|jgi:azurin/ribosomal protein S7
MKRRILQLLPAIALTFGACGTICLADDQPAVAGGAVEKPHVLLDKSPRVVAYQLKRLTNAQLVLVDRKPDEAKYKPVYEAILTRKGMDTKYRDEAVKALAQLDKSSPVVVLLDAIGQADPEDKATPRELIGMLMAQKPADLAAQKEKIQALATSSQNPIVKQAAYAALVAGGEQPDAVWQLALSKNEQKELIAGIPLIKDGKLRAAFFDKVNPLVTSAPDPATQVAAVDAVSSMPGHEAEAFKELAGLIGGGKGEVRDAAVRAIRRINSDKWPQEQVEPLANAVVKLVKDTPADQRTGPQIGQAVQLGNDLAGELEDVKGQAIRKQLRELAVPVVVIRTLREQMQYDTKYFVVQAGKPVEVTLDNGDAMPHNLVITVPGAMQEVAVAAGTMPPPSDDTKKAYVPESPKVLDSLAMVQPEESATMTFTAPKTPGEYDFVCTFPGHWVRMYGVMLVVPDLDAWEKNPTPPKDPMTHKAYESQKNEATGAMAGMEH